MSVGVGEAWVVAKPPTNCSSALAYWKLDCPCTPYHPEDDLGYQKQHPEGINFRYQKQHYDEKHYDVVVFGATPAGVAASVAARRQGAMRVALVEPSRWIGGMMASGLGCTDKCGGSSYGGIAAEFVNRTQRSYPTNRQLPHCTRAFEPHIAKETFEAMLDEAGVTVFLSHTLLQAVHSGRRIQSLRLEGPTEAVSRISAEVSGFSV
jgi:NADPH-dependent 2,4-dienoyl-CoA reductase/sulfur reductase-like enzyme